MNQTFEVGAQSEMVISMDPISLGGFNSSLALEWTELWGTISASYHRFMFTMFLKICRTYCEQIDNFSLFFIPVHSWNSGSEIRGHLKLIVTKKCDPCDKNTFYKQSLSKCSHGILFYIKEKQTK